MNAKRRKWLGVVGGLVALGLMIGVYAWTDREPSYQGKRLGEWLEAIQIPGLPGSGGGGSFGVGTEGGFGSGEGGFMVPGKSGSVVTASGGSASEEVRAALVELGPRAAPHLGRRILERDSQWVKRLTEWLNKMPWIRLSHTPAEVQRQRALKAFKVIGPDGDRAVPKLINGLKHRWSRAASIEALGYIGPQADECIPHFTKLLAGMPDKLKIKMLSAWKRIGVGRNAVMPLVELLKADRNEPSWMAASMLAKSGSTAEAPLLEILGDGEFAPNVRASAAWAIAPIKSASSEVRGKLVELACDTSEPLIVRQSAVNAIGRIGIKDKAVLKNFKISEAVDVTPNWDLIRSTRNGDFEQPDIMAPDVSGRNNGSPLFDVSPGQGRIPSWNVYEGIVRIRMRRGGGGSQIMELGPKTAPGCIAQTFITVPGKSYEVTFFAEPRRNKAVKIGVGSLQARLDLSVNGNDPRFHRFNLEFRAKSWLSTLSFSAVGERGYGPMIDNVVVSGAD